MRLATARPDWDVEDALEVMAREQVGRLPVVDEDNRLVGVVTLGSLVLRGEQEREALEAARQVARRAAKRPEARAGRRAAARGGKRPKDRVAGRPAGRRAPTKGRGKSAARPWSRAS